MKRTSDVTGPAPLKTKGEKSCKLHAAICSRPASCARVPPLPQASRSRPPPQSSPSRRSPARSGTSSWWARASRASAPRSKPRKRAPRFFSSRRWAVPTARPPTAPAGSPRRKRYQDKDDDDSKELYFKEMMEVSGGRSDPALIRAYAEIAGESVDWLGDHGMTYKIWRAKTRPNACAATSCLQSTASRAAPTW